jgi:hypothetical protein
VNERRKKNISFLKNQSLEFYMKIWFKKHVLRYNINHPESVIFFTIYDIEVRPGDHIIKHGYREVKKLIKGMAKTNQVFLLGQPLSEIHPEILTEESYFNYLAGIKHYFSGNELIYIPHRDELEEKLLRIESQADIPVKRIDLPVELFLLNQVQKPSVIAGFITSALPNCKEIFGSEVEIVSIRLDSNKIISKSMLAAVESTYTYFEKISDQKFNIISID